MGRRLWDRFLVAEGVRTDVANRGRGVAEPDRAKLFHRIFRADAARQSPGTALALAIAAAIAELHNMEVATFDNAPGLQVVPRSVAQA